MRKTVEIIGIQHKFGKNDKGEYDFYLLHAINVGEEANVEGQEAIVATIRDEDLPYVRIGDVKEIFIQFYKGRANVAYYPHD